MPESGDPTKAAFNRPETVDIYAKLEGLTPCERYLFEKHIPKGANVLDLGVGAGRTTAILSDRAGSYVGLDFAPEMIRACRERFPGLDLRVQDAADLSAFPDASFDAAVFSFNGL